jgi:vacuolar-type H+-ATPase subunit I/STV1
MKNKKWHEGSKTWQLRVFCLAIGAIMTWSGFYGFFHGNLWYTHYNASVGQFTTSNSLMLGILGVLAILLGVLMPRKFLE